MYVTGTLLIQHQDYMQAVSAVDFDVTGQMIYVTYIDSNGNLRAASKSFIQAGAGVENIMSGCSIIQ